MSPSLRRMSWCLPLLLFVACGSSNNPSTPATDTGAPNSANAALFDPTTSTIPLPNVLATATASDPLALRAADKPMTPAEALAYVNLHEMGGTNAVSGMNAPIYLRFTYPVDPATVTPANIKVFQLAADALGTENQPLGFTDVSATFSYRYAKGTTDLFLFPNFPLLPGTRYLYVVTDGVKDAASGGSVISSIYFEALKSTTPLTGALAPLEAIRANVAVGTDILFSGYAKVMDDLITAKAATGISSRASIALLGRFITTGAGFIVPDLSNTSTRIPVETAIRQFAAGAALGGLSGKTWDNTVTIPANTADSVSVFVKGTAASPDLYWQAVTGSSAATAPSTVGAVVLGTFESADLSIDPVVAGAHASAMDLTGVTGAYNPAAGVAQAFRDSSHVLTGFYHTSRTIHFLYIAPDEAAPAGGYPLVIYQHGITRQKEDAIAVAQALTSIGRAVLAIDLPLHQSNQIVDGTTNHTTGSEWGNDFMALGAPLAARTNVQQGALNLDRAEFVVLTGSLDAALIGAGVADKIPNVTVKPRIVGHSLGSIVAAYYLAGNTTLSATGYPYTQDTLNADMKGFLSSPGACPAYIIESSPWFGPIADAGLAAVGIAKDTPTYHQFFQVTQTVVDTVDPATMTTPLGAGLPSRLSGRILMQEATSTEFSGVGSDLNPIPTNGDQTIINPYCRYFANALGGRGVLGDAGALVAPGFKQLAYLGGGSPAHVAGVPAAFLFTLSNGAPVPKIADAAGTPAATGPSEGFFQFDQSNMDHGFLIDNNSTTNTLLGQKQMLYFLGANGGFGAVGTALVVDPTQQALGMSLLNTSSLKGVRLFEPLAKPVKILGY